MKRWNFTLSRRNQKGQIAIFVALIFQVIFIFFAVLINVGLLVHHKINLQQSTDLAAYYGAMKQAEIMNAISHVNFQMRQAWKLLTWRYRIVGTFGFRDTDGVTPAQKLTFPLEIALGNTTPTTFIGANATTVKCPGIGLNILDVPFFCAGHAGFQGWSNPNENNCRVNCDQLNSVSTRIPAVLTTGGFDSQFTGGVIGAVNVALTQANQNILNICTDLGPVNFSILAKFLMGYGFEVDQKKKLIQMLGANLSADVGTAVDMEGGLIKTGSQSTFDNNLTEANKTGKISFETMNGLRAGDGSCAFQGAANDGEDGTNQFLNEIRLQAVQYFVHLCSGTRDTDKNFLPQSLFSDGALSVVRDEYFNASTLSQKATIINAIASIKYILGYEKNPWCQVYYGAKAQTEPRIPFLPLAKVKLSAVSIAKPFGGSIGPRYFQNWSAGSPASDSGQQVDLALPVKKIAGIPPGPPLVSSSFLLPNYGNFVGDRMGLKDPVTAATYQDILLYRQLTADVPGSLNISQGKTNGQAAAIGGIVTATVWPSYSSWNQMSNPAGANYDYLATDPAGATGKNSFLRDLEISVIAPNQFDLSYYSIDPDYYNNYYLKMKGGTAGTLNFTGSFAKIAQAAGYGPPSINDIKPDYGYNEAFINNNSIAKGYSVRHQIAVASKVIKAASHQAVGPWPSLADSLNFIPNNPSSLLTGWTFKNFSDYNTFPSVGPDNENTMTFGKCKDANWNNTGDSSPDKLFDTPVTTRLPPTPGNCVWGGRTGYSVKIISPSVIRAGAPPQDYGGAGAGSIRNTADESFFTF